MKQKIVCVESPDSFLAELRRIAAAEGDEVFVLSHDERHRGQPNVIDVDPRSDHGRAVAGIADLVGRPDAVLTSQEMFLTQAAALADAFGVARDPVSAVAASRDKAQMKRAWVDAGVRTPRSRFFSSAAGLQDELVALVALESPLIAKPSTGYASCGVRRTESAGELLAHLRNIFLINATLIAKERLPDVGFLVEEYVDGPEYSIDTVWFAGEPLCDGIMSKGNACGPYFPDRLYYVDPDLPVPTAARLRALSYRAVRALGISSGATHTEIRVRGDEPFVLETTNRPGAGGMFYRVFTKAYGIDFHRVYYLAAVCSDRDELDRRIGPLRPRTPDPAEYGFWYSVPHRGSGLIREVRGVADLRARPEIDLCLCYKRPGTMLYPEGLEPDYLCTLVGTYRPGPGDPAVEDFVTTYDHAIEVIF